MAGPAQAGPPAPAAGSSRTLFKGNAYCYTRRVVRKKVEKEQR